MNILFLSHYFPPEVNAPATRTYEHCKRWVASGHTVEVVTCAPNCPDGIVYEGYRNRYSREIIDGIQITRVWTMLAPNKGFVKRIINYLSFLCSAFVHCVIRKNVDVVIATSPQFFCGWAGVLLKWCRKWPFILEIRDIWPESIVTVGAMKKSKTIALLEVLEKRMYRAADRIVAVGAGYRQKIIERGISPEKIDVVLNGADVEQFKTISDTSSLRKRYRSENKFVCSYIGTVGMAHGLDVMLDAGIRLKKQEKNDVVFWIVGDGANREALAVRVKEQNIENVIFTGRLPKEEMPAIIASSDCCLVHLRGTELFGTVIPSKIFELMAMNVPIIMAVKGEAQEIVLMGGAGVVMDPDNPESLLTCIRQIRERGRESFKGRDFVATFYNRNTLADDMLGIIEGVYEGRKLLLKKA